MSKPEFVYVTYIETTPEKLWEALTDGEFTKRYWFGTRREVGLEGRLALRAGARDGKTTDTGEILEADRAAAAVLHLRKHELYEDDARARARKVAFTIEPYGKLVKLTVTHEGFAEGSKLRRRHLQRDGRRSCPASRACSKPESRLRSRGPRSAKKNSPGHEDLSKDQPRHEHRPIQARDRLHDLHRLHAREGVAGADDGRVQPASIFPALRSRPT